jgi:hypothetical protein
MKTRNKFMSALMGVLFLITLLLTLAAPPQAKAGANDWTPLGVQEQARWGFTHTATFYATNFLGWTSNSATAAFPVPGNGSFNFGAGTVIDQVAIRLEEQFANTNAVGLTNCTISVGDTTDNARFITTFELGTNQTVGYVAFSAGTNAIYNVATNLTFKIRPIGVGINMLTNGGRFKAFVRVRDMSLP